MESVNRRLILAGAGLAGVAALAKLAKAGPLEPPAGPIQPTGATLEAIRSRQSAIGLKVARTDQGFAEARTPVQSCPSSADAQFVITQPGSYYMTGDVTGVPGKCCIDVQCSDVDIDCDNFTFQGVQGTLSCIRCAAPAERVCVSSAKIRSWVKDCYDGRECAHCTLEDCSFIDCASPPDPTGGGGFCCDLGAGSEILYCDFIRCHAGACRVADRCTIECCRALQCDSGFHLADDCVCESSVCVECPGPAIVCQSRCVCDDNQVVRCAGIDCAGSQSCISDNELCDCTGAGGGGGGSGGSIYVRGEGCCIDENSVTQVGGIAGGVIAGIVIAASARNALIECNQLAGCPVVVEFGATGCLCVCNTCRPPAGSLAFSIADGNSYGPIFNVQGVGNIGAMQGSGHSWANYAH